MPNHEAPLGDDVHDIALDDTGPQQERVRSLLGQLPDPGPMPDDLVVRIQARLADEALHRGTGSTVVDLAARRRARRMGVLAAVGSVAASAAVVGVLAAGGLQSLTKAPAHDELTLRGSAAAASTAAATRGTVQLRTSSTPVTASTLDARASALLTETFTSTAAPSTAAGSSATDPATTDGLRRCLASLGAGSPSRVAAELTTYDGSPAAVVGLRTAGGELQAWVLGRTCSELVPHHAIS